MGCISSKRAAPGSPCIEYSAAVAGNGAVLLEPSVSNKKKNKDHNNNHTSSNPELGKTGSTKNNSFNNKDHNQTHNQIVQHEKDKDKDKSSDDHKSRELKKSKKDGSSHGKGGFSFRFGFSHRSLEAEQVAAGWPSWLSTAAGEAIYGWVPLRADAYEKLEKVPFIHVYKSCMHHVSLNDVIIKCSFLLTVISYVEKIITTIVCYF